MNYLARGGSMRYPDQKKTMFSGSVPQSMMNSSSFKKDFPLLAEQNIIYLDSAATSQKPLVVLQQMEKFYKEQNANPHRGIYSLSEAATKAYENSREVVANFINAKPTEIVFVKNATEAFNLIANSWGKKNLQKEDRIVLSEMEHHSNIVPWQQIANETGAIIERIPLNTEHSALDMAEYTRLFSTQESSEKNSEHKKDVKIVGTTHISNVLGTINPINEMTRIAHQNGAVVLVDACQSAGHIPIDVKELDADFLVFSGHKMFGPSGIGVLYAKEEHLKKMPPFLTGGDMIKTVLWEKSTWADLPHKFEAGTPPVAEAVGLAAAIEYISSIGFSAIQSHENALTRMLHKELAAIEGVMVLGPSAETARGVIVSFVVNNVHPHDVASILNECGVCIRSGHQCAMPLHTSLNLSASCRASISIYNIEEDITALVAGLIRVKEVFRL